MGVVHIHTVCSDGCIPFSVLKEPALILKACFVQEVGVMKAREGRGVKPDRERVVGVEPFTEGRGRESEALQRRKREGK